MTNPYFIRLIQISAVVATIFILIISIFSDAPLQEPAEPSNVPNPSKSAWFLLWLQELVSYNVYFIYVAICIYAVLLLAPFFVKNKPIHAKWFSKDMIVINIFTILSLLLIILLTIIAYFFRGEYWAFIL